MGQAFKGLWNQLLHYGVYIGKKDTPTKFTLWKSLKYILILIYNLVYNVVYNLYNK